MQSFAEYRTWSTFFFSRQRFVARNVFYTESLKLSCMTLLGYQTNAYGSRQASRSAALYWFLSTARSFPCVCAFLRERYAVLIRCNYSDVGPSHLAREARDFGNDYRCTLYTGTLPLLSTVPSGSCFRHFVLRFLATDARCLPPSPPLPPPSRFLWQAFWRFTSASPGLWTGPTT